MSTKKTPKDKTPKEKTDKQLLAYGAKKIREEKAANKVAKKKKPETKGAEMELMPKIEECKDDIGEIVQRRVIPTKNDTAIKLHSDTTSGEFMRIFDNIVADIAEKKGSAEIAILRLGDAINCGQNLKAFGGKFAVAMASTGRPISSLRTYASVAANTPANMRGLHSDIKFEHLRVIKTIPAIEDKKSVLDKAVKAAKEGHPLTVKQLKDEAKPLIPPPTKPRAGRPAKAAQQAIELREPTVDESAAMIDLEESASNLCALIGGSSFLTEIKKDEYIPLREKLETISRFFAKLP